MPQHARIKIEGRIGDVFFHRFVVELTSGERILADVGPAGVEAFSLNSGTEIVAEGEMKPSELKIERIGRKGEGLVELGHKAKPHHGRDHQEEHGDLETAKHAVTQAGFETIGEPRRKPKHFEVLSRRGHRLFECHVALDGHIRKEKPVDPDDPKWSHELSHAA